MSTPNNGLILHLNFDEVADWKLADLSGKGNVAKLQGNPQTDFDDKVGGCLVLDGVDDYVSLNDLNADYSKGLTVEAWVFYSKFKTWSRIIELGNGPSADNIILANEGETDLLGFYIYEGATRHGMKAPGPLKLNVWMHIAATIDAGGSAKIYIDGKEVASGTLPRPRNVARANSYIGMSNWGDMLFQGKLGSLRVYNRALSAEEVRRDMNKDVTAAFTFRADNPLEFTLYDRESKQEAVYITDKPDGREVSFEVANASTQPITLAAPAPVNKSKPGPDNYHFELRFRPGTLSAAALHGLKLDSPAGWSLHKPASDGAARNGSNVSLYLLSDVECKLEQGERLTLKLSGVSADLGVGARGTRAEMKFRQTPDQKNLQSGARVRHLQVINHSGVKGVPLHAGFFGSNTVLNDGKSQNTLTLRITNTSDKDLTLTPDPDGKASAPSKFIISFDVEANENENDSKKEWALGIESQVNRIVIKENGTSLRREAGKSEWSLTNKMTSIPKGGHIELQLGEVNNGVVTGGIVTNLPTGPAKVYIRYENIPGHWDGELVAIIEKAPAVYRSDKVGIGTANPATRLHVAGAGDTELSLQSNDNNRRWTLQANGGRAGERLAGYFQIIDRTAGESRLTVNTVGNVGIGTTDPTRTLHVNGGLRVEKDVSVGVDEVFKVDAPNMPGGRLSITKDGNVGIGTDEPDTKLVIEGDRNQIIKQRQSVQMPDGQPYDVGGIIYSDTHLRDRAESSPAAYLKIRSVNTNRDWLQTVRGTQLEFGTANGQQGWGVTASTRMTITPDGNVGIGTDDPKNKLDVNGDVAIQGKHAIRGNDGWLRLNQDGAFTDGVHTPHLLTSMSLNVGNWSDPGAGNVSVTGNVFIGRNDHSAKAKLVVGAGPRGNYGGFTYLNGGGVSGNHDGYTNRSYSIYATDIIGAETFMAFSDERIKDIRGRSDGAADLRTLLGIEITDYHHKDVIGKGDAVHKKLIGQQVKEVFPQAVGTLTDVVPDIYRCAPFADGWAELAAELKVGERVRLIAPDAQGVYEVLEVCEGKFRTDFKPEGGEVFVFGREVDDFLVVDYEAIAMLNVSATQQLKKEKDDEVKALREEIAELRAAANALTESLRLLEGERESGPVAERDAKGSVVEVVKGSNGNGRH